MPIKYNIIEEQKLILATGSAIVTANDVISHLDSLATENKYIAPMKKLVDYRTIESIIISPDEAEAIAQRKKELSKKFSNEKCAFISPGDLTFGTARVHQALVENTDINTAVFRNIEEALEWLDVTLDVNHENDYEEFI